MSPTIATNRSAFVVSGATVIVPAFPVMLPAIALEKVLTPKTVSFPVFITAPAADTLVASVLSARSSMPDSLFLSAVVMIEPDPTPVTSERAVTLLVV